MQNNFKMQKVLHLKDELEKKKPKLSGERIVTEKFNGWFTFTYFDSEKRTWGVPHSSGYRPIPAFEHLPEKFNKIAKPGANVILIAEAIIPDLPFEKANGIFNRSVGNYRCDDVVFKLHDAITLIPGLYQTNVERYKKLRELDRLNELWQVVPVLDTVDLSLPAGMERWKELFHEVTQKGGEGLVGKLCNEVYHYGKRNSSLVKEKLECAIDCLAVRLEETVGKEGFTSLTLVSKRKSGTEIRTVIGAHTLQDKFRADPESVLGKVVQIKGMYEYPDGGIKEPVFQWVRDDKLPHEYE